MFLSKASEKTQKFWAGFSHEKQDWAVFCIFFLTCLLLLLRSFNVNNWRATHFLFSFQDGFVSRALIGTLIRTFFSQYFGSFAAIKIISAVILVVYSLLLSISGSRYWRGDRSLPCFLNVMIILTSPATIAFMAGEAGCFDTAAYALAMIALLFLPVLPKRLHWLFVSLVALTLVLIHEVMLMLPIPLLVACILSKNYSIEPSGQLRGLKAAVFWMLPAILFAGYCLTFARFELSQDSFRQTMALLQNYADFEIQPGSVMVHFRALRENVLLTSKNLLYHGIFSFFIIFPSLVTAFEITRHSTAVRSQLAARIVLCSVPLAVSLVGFDYPRWFAAVTLNFFISGVLSEQRQDCPAQSGNLSLVGVIVFNLVAGPVKVL